MSNRSASLLEGSIPRHLVRLTIPMIGGIFAMSAFNLVDAYFVAQLGTDALAAVSFTFPVVMVVGAIAMGLGMSASILVSQAIGRDEREQTRRIATSSLLLAVAVVAVVAGAGLVFMDPLFAMLGAGPDVMPLIRSYMTLWFSCVWVLIIPMVGNNCIRATGDMLTPGLIMIGLAVLNAVLDPLFIFGLGPIPPMGIFGAALATVLSRGIGTFVSLALLSRRYGLIDWHLPGLRNLLRHWGAALHVALPSAATHLLMPVSSGVVTRLVAVYGNETVAAVGASGRVLHLLYMIPMALGSVLIPFAGQNWAAGSTARVRDAWCLSNRFSLYYGLVSLVLFLPVVEPVAALFGEGAMFVWGFELFILCTLATSGLQHVAVHSGFVLNAIGYPVVAFFFNAARTVLLMCPLAWLGREYFGLCGLFAGVALAQALSGLGIRWALPVVFRKHGEAA